MAKIVIAGAGFAGHYAALILHDALKGKGKHEITVINRFPHFVYYPSLIWVGIGTMKAKDTTFPLEPVYKKLGIKFKVGAMTEVFPDNQKVTFSDDQGNTEKLEYDYLLVATGPKLNFEATPGLGPHGGFTYSVCSPPHAIETGKAYQEAVRKMTNGEKQTIVIGTGHGTCTCQGAAFEYITNVHNDLMERGLRDKAHIIWLSNEPKLGDFGIDGLEVMHKGEIFTSEMMLDAVFDDYKVEPIIRSHVHNITADTISIENLDGQFRDIHYDFAMLLPPFKGQPIQYFNREGKEITGEMCNPGGFLKVDANYGKSYDELDGPDWPSTYQNPLYKNIYGAGIAFAPPGPLSKPGKSPNGTVISPAPPRTGYTSELSGKAAALNIAQQILGKIPDKTASMAETPGLCIASLQNHLFRGSAATIALYPVARDYSKYPEYGRDLSKCTAEVGLAGAWTKVGLHHAFMYKLKAKPFWKYIP